MGSTRTLTDEEGNVTDTYDYDAFGELIDSEGNSENSYLFAGEQFDKDLEDYYLRQRFYDPGSGRFLRRDTYEGRLNEPITLHKYLYANANPVYYTDPTGLFSSIAELSQSISVMDILAATSFATGLAGIMTNGEPLSPLGGFGDGPQPDIPAHTGRGRTDLLNGLLERLGGFGEGDQPDVSDTIVDSFDDLRDLLSSVFSSVRDILYPNGQRIGKAGSNKTNRELQGDVNDALDLLGEIVKEGGGFTDITPKGYEGIRIRLPNGEEFAVRDKMTKSPRTNATLEVDAPISAPGIKKIKFNQ